MRQTRNPLNVQGVIKTMPRKTRLNRKPQNAPATAAGQALGYGLQYTRLTFMLLEAGEGSKCSLEVLDDVAEQTTAGTTKLGQSKSALTTNPVADRAIPLWKTLFNWLELAKRQIVVPSETVFELYVSRPVDGHLIRAFHDSRSCEEARVALKEARKELWGETDGYNKEGALSKDLRRYVNPVIQADEDILLPIIINLRLVCGSGSPQADIEAAISRGPVSAARVSDIADKMCGWVKRQVDKRLEKALPAVISRDDFHREYVSYVRRVDRDLILKSMAATPTDAEKQECLPDTFVQQLDLIDLGFDDKLEAISDFLRACSDRTLWSRAGDVHEDSFKELDRNLNRAWTNHRRATEIEAASKAEVERGQLLHARCMLHEAKVQGMEPPSHFISGCFHRLADERDIGWHPDYRNLIGTAIAKTP